MSWLPFWPEAMVDNLQSQLNKALQWLAKDN